MPTGLIDTATAAQRKHCSRNAILDAIKRGAIDGQQTGRYFVVMANKKFEEWSPNPGICFFPFPVSAICVKGWRTSNMLLST